MKTILIKIIFISLLFFPIYLFAQDDFFSQGDFLTSAEKNESIDRALANFDQDTIGQQDAENIGKEAYPTGPFPNMERARVIEKTLDKTELEVGIGIGYLNGHTSYEIDFPYYGYTGRSKLGFPIDNLLAGGNILLGRQPFYLNLQGWTNISKNTDDKMKDKDWLEWLLFSSTESDADAQMAILDLSLLYNFWQKDEPCGDVLGFLVGYKYENFKYDIIGVRDAFTGENYYSGKASDYKINYQIPYLGLNLQHYNDVGYKVLDSWGVNILICGSPYVIAKDRDDHILRNKVLQGKAKGYAFLLGLNTFFTTKNHWGCRLGLDYTDISADGKQRQYWYGDDPASPYYDDTGDSIDGISLKIESSQLLCWGLLEYKF